MNKMKALLLVVVMLFVVSIPVFAAEPQVGDMLPDFMVKDLQGNDVKISDFRGQYVLYDVWASWCGPCKKALKAYIQNMEKFTDARVKIVAVSVDAKVEDAVKYSTQEKFSFTTLHDVDKQCKAQWGVRGIPTVFLVDPQGKIIMKEIGFDDFATLWDKITEVLPEKPVSKVTYPKLKAGTYNAQPVKADFSAMSPNLTLGFFQSEEFDFVDKCELKLVKEPKYAQTPKYGVITIGDLKYAIAAFDAKKSGFIDTSYVDFNRNGDLTDDGNPIEWPKFSNYTEVEFPLNVTPAKGDPITYLVTCYSYNGENKYYLTTGTGYESSISTDGKAVKVLLLDANANGIFTEPQDVLLMDLDGNGLYDSFSAIINWTTLGAKLKLGALTYQFKINQNGKQIVVEEVK